MSTVSVINISTADVEAPVHVVEMPHGWTLRHPGPCGASHCDDNPCTFAEYHKGGKFQGWHFLPGCTGRLAPYLHGILSAANLGRTTLSESGSPWPAVDRPPTLDDLARQIVDWQRRTFPTATLISSFTHFRREVEEVAMDPGDGEELADLFHLLVAVADHAGVDLAEQVARKFQKNLTRRWKAPDADGVVEHEETAT